MFSTNLKSLVSLCCLISLIALTAVTAPLAGAAATSTAFTVDDGNGPVETYYEVCDDTEQPVNADDQIVFVVKVAMHGIIWFEAETPNGSRYLINDMETNPSGGGHGPVQIGGKVYYVCWD